jgi:intracellular sulfur oxidation DsrE/DsrF family protein
MPLFGDSRKLRSELEKLRAENSELSECVAPLRELGMSSSDIAELIKVVALGVRAKAEAQAAKSNSFHASSSSDAAMAVKPPSTNRIDL